jgi:hypothetical protein
VQDTNSRDEQHGRDARNKVPCVQLDSAVM